MNVSAPLESLLKRDRLIVGAGLFAIAAVAWGYMVHEAHKMAVTGVCQCFGLKMAGPDLQSWGAWELTGLFFMWTEMMVAMMVPSAAPMVLTFAAVNRRRQEQERPYVSTAIFLLGYLIVWTGFSAAATLAQWGLHSAALLSAMMVSTSPLLGGALLAAAGVFQWTPLKHRCVTHCRSPISFFSTEWREGKLGALRMGLQHGFYCTGCCWFLMALLFVLGVMNIWWIAVITIFVLIEKVLPPNRWLAWLSGASLVLWGAWMMIRR